MFRFLLLIALVLILAVSLYRLIVRLGARAENELKEVSDLDLQLEALEQKKKSLASQCAEDIANASKKIRDAQRVRNRMK